MIPHKMIRFSCNTTPGELYLALLNEGQVDFFNNPYGPRESNPTDGVRYYGQKVDESSMGRASEQAATTVGTNRQYVSDAKKLSEHLCLLLAYGTMWARSLLDGSAEMQRVKS